MLDGKEFVCFAWIKMYRQEQEISAGQKEMSDISYEDTCSDLKLKWGENGTHGEMDFLDVALQFRSMRIQDALKCDNYIVKILAILDKYVGKRMLQRIAAEQQYAAYPDWVRNFTSYGSLNSDKVLILIPFGQRSNKR